MIPKLEIEAPDVQTPVVLHGAHPGFGAHLQTYFPTPSQPQAQICELMTPTDHFPLWTIFTLLIKLLLEKQRLWLLHMIQVVEF